MQELYLDYFLVKKIYHLNHELHIKCLVGVNPFFKILANMLKFQ